MTNEKLTDCWEVTLVAQCVVFVRGAKDYDEAMEFAHDEVSCGEYEFVEGTAQQLTESSVDSVRRHADKRSEPR